MIKHEDRGAADNRRVSEIESGRMAAHSVLLVLACTRALVVSTPVTTCCDTGWRRKAGRSYKGAIQLSVWTVAIDGQQRSSIQ